MGKSLVMKYLLSLIVVIPLWAQFPVLPGVLSSSSVAAAPPALVCSASQGGPSGGNTYTTAQNCSAAKLFVVTATWYIGGGCTTGALTDTSSNSFNSLSDYSTGAELRHKSWYLFNPSTSSSYQIKIAITGSGCAPALNYQGFSGTFAGLVDIVSAQYGSSVTSMNAYSGLASITSIVSGTSSIVGAMGTTVCLTFSGNSDNTSAIGIATLATANTLVGASVNIISSGMGFTSGTGLASVPSASAGGCTATAAGPFSGSATSLAVILTGVTPNHPNEVVVSGYGNITAVTALALSGFSLLNTVTFASGTTAGGGMGYLLSPTSGTLISPVWSWTTSSTYNLADIYSFY